MPDIWITSSISHAKFLKTMWGWWRKRGRRAETVFFRFLHVCDQQWNFAQVNWRSIYKIKTALQEVETLWYENESSVFAPAERSWWNVNKTSGVVSTSKSNQTQTRCHHVEPTLKISWNELWVSIFKIRSRTGDSPNMLFSLQPANVSEPESS